MDVVATHPRTRMKLPSWDASNEANMKSYSQKISILHSYACNWWEMNPTLPLEKRPMNIFRKQAQNYQTYVVSVRDTINFG